jgi:hypothetical protein
MLFNEATTEEGNRAVLVAEPVFEALMEAFDKAYPRAEVEWEWGEKVFATHTFYEVTIRTKPRRIVRFRR